MPAITLLISIEILQCECKAKCEKYKPQGLMNTRFERAGVQREGQCLGPGPCRP